MFGCPEIGGVNFRTIFASIVFFSGYEIYVIMFMITN